MEEHRTASGAGQAMGELGGEQADVYGEIIAKLQKSKKLTRKGVKYDPYKELNAKGEILALVSAGKAVKQVKAGDKVAVVLPATPFYIASGGQISDTGEIASPTGKWRIKVTDTQQPAAGALVHLGEVVAGNPKVGDKALAQVDRRRRQDIMRNHTATHLLHAALHEVVGEHARQAGSLVAPDRLRFDFTNPQAVSKEDLAKIEEKVNGWILDNYELHKETKSLEQAKKEGAMALFGEKYGEQVRTISIGEDGEPFSYELCGGTHVEHTSDIGLFLIVSEGSAAAGVRRIEAVTGRGAYALAKARNSALGEAASMLKATALEVPEKVVNLQKELAAAQKQLNASRNEIAHKGAAEVFQNIQQVGEVPVLAVAVPGADADALRALADHFRQRHSSGVALLAGAADGRITLIAAITKDLVARGLHAGDLVKAAAAPLGGSGGGKPELAQAGGNDNGKLDEALAVAKNWVKEKLG
jgi:alanyl-tRNA synthetase